MPEKRMVALRGDSTTQRKIREYQDELQFLSNLVLMENYG